MKLFAKLILYAFLTVILFTVVVFAFVEYAEEAVLKITLKETNKTFGTELDVKDINLSFINEFPFTSIELIDVSLVNPTQEMDTIIQSKSIALAVKPFDLIDGNIDIAYARWNDAHIHFFTDSLGRNNFDFLLKKSSLSDSDTTSSSSLFLDVNDVIFKNISFQFEDRTLQAKSTVLFSELYMQASLKDKEKQASLKGQIELYEAGYAHSTLERLEQLKIDINAKLYNDSIQLINGYIESEGIKSAIKGLIQLDDHFNSNLSISGTELQLQDLKKYIPDSLIQSYGIESTSGLVSIDATIEGALVDSILPQITATIILKDVSACILNYPPIKAINADLTYTNGIDRSIESTSINIKNLNARTEKSYVSLKAQFQNLNQINYAFNSNINIDFDELKAFIPENMELAFSGQLQSEISSRGIIPDPIDLYFFDQLLENSLATLVFNEVELAMDSSVSIKELNGQFEYSSKQFDLSSLSCFLPEYDLRIKPSTAKGHFTGAPSQLDEAFFQLDTFNLNVNSSHLKGKAHYQNGIKPAYEIVSQLDVDLADWAQFIPDSIVSQFTGQFQANINSKGNYHPDSIQMDAMELLFTQSYLDLKTTDLNISSWDEKVKLDDFFGKVEMKNDTIFLDKLTGSFNGSEFMADSTLITALYNAVLLNQAKQVKVEGTFHLDELDYATIEPFLVQDSTAVNVNSSDSISTNYTFLVRGKASAYSLKYDNATFYNVNSYFSLSDSLYILDDLYFEAFNGKMLNSIKYKIEPNNQQEIWVKNNIQGMDIDQLLRDFNNFEDFGNDNITHEQINGLFTTNLDGHFVMKDGDLQYDAIELSGDMLLEEGRLKDYGIAAEIGKENNIDNLDNLEFNTIETKVFIYKNVIYVPRTNINNNALDVTIYGRQEFGDDCKYHLRFYLKELLKRGQAKNIERKKNKKDTKEHGGVKGSSNVFVFYEIEEGKTKMWRESKNSKKAEQLRMIIKMQETGLKITFNPRAISYETGVNKND